ncbi:MAG: nucleotide exchange factor GrpE [Spirochaetes bacterium RBG_16_49_21]|nr:MAG: nucleotide exchange factor GrpE [Spirochaetes bacterium RBG_16_49_21]
MDKHKEHQKHHKEKNVHEDKERAQENPDISDEALEKKIEDEMASDERRKELRRECDRIAADEKKKAIAENEQLKAEIATFKDTMIRRQADFENYKKRVLKQHGETRIMTIKDLAHDFILINDDLLRAIEASEKISGETTEELYKSFREGVIMISRRIEEILKKYNVVEIDSLNQEFDPAFHEAVEIEQDGAVGHDTVTKVYHKGFRIDDLVVRSAKVKVTRPKSEPAVASQASAEHEDAGDGRNKSE